MQFKCLVFGEGKSAEVTFESHLDNPRDIEKYACRMAFGGGLFRTRPEYASIIVPVDFYDWCEDGRV